MTCSAGKPRDPRQMKGDPRQTTAAPVVLESPFAGAASDFQILDVAEVSKNLAPSVARDALALKHGRAGG
jgi:hypothetical protein